MTIHSLTCTHCGFRVQSENLEDLVNEKRSCPLCEHSSWELHERDNFPCSQRERKFIYQKLLFVIQWCQTEKPCEHNGYCPIQKHCKNGDYEAAFIQWLKETEL